MFVLRRRKDKQENTNQSGIGHTTKSSFPQYPKGSITRNLDRYHNRFIDSNTESTATTKTSTVKTEKAKTKESVKSSEIEYNKGVSPSKKMSVSPPKKTSDSPTKAKLLKKKNKH